MTIQTQIMMMGLMVRGQFSNSVLDVRIFFLYWSIINNMDQSNVEKMYSDHFVWGGGGISSSCDSFIKAIQFPVSDSILVSLNGQEELQIEILVLLL